MSGLLCCCGINGVLAIILGLVAHRQIKRNPDTYTGSGLATAGIVLGVLSILLILVFGAFMINRYQTIKPVAETATAHFQRGECSAASVYFAPSVGETPDFNNACVRIQNQLQPLGEFHHLSTGYSLQIVNNVTQVRFTGHFENGTAHIACAFTEQNDDWRLVQYWVQ